MVRYELRPVGVFDRETGRHITRGSPGWAAYLAWVAAGNAAELPPPAELPSIEVRRETARARVNAERARRLAGGLAFAGHAFDTDDASRANLTAMVAAVAAGIPLPPGFAWRTQDNVDVPLDAQGLLALGAAMLAHGEACYARSWQLKGAIDASEEPELLNVLAGWPD